MFIWPHRLLRATSNVAFMSGHYENNCNPLAALRNRDIIQTHSLASPDFWNDINTLKMVMREIIKLTDDSSYNKLKNSKNVCSLQLKKDIIHYRILPTITKQLHGSEWHSMLQYFVSKVLFCARATRSCWKRLKSTNPDKYRFALKTNVTLLEDVYKQMKKKEKKIQNRIVCFAVRYVPKTTQQKLHHWEDKNVTFRAVFGKLQRRFGLRDSCLTLMSSCEAVMLTVLRGTPFTSTRKSDSVREQQGRWQDSCL